MRGLTDQQNASKPGKRKNFLFFPEQKKGGPEAPGGGGEKKGGKTRGDATAGSEFCSWQIQGAARVCVLTAAGLRVLTAAELPALLLLVQTILPSDPCYLQSVSGCRSRCPDFDCHVQSFWMCLLDVPAGCVSGCTLLRRCCDAPVHRRRRRLRTRTSLFFVQERDDHVHAGSRAGPPVAAPALRALHAAQPRHSCPIRSNTTTSQPHRFPNRQAQGPAPRSRPRRRLWPASGGFSRQHSARCGATGPFWALHALFLLHARIGIPLSLAWRSQKARCWCCSCTTRATVFLFVVKACGGGDNWWLLALLYASCCSAKVVLLCHHTVLRS